jgi:hypothetical protein
MLPDPFPNTAVDPLQMRFRSPGADDKKIGERRDFTQVENNNVFGLLIFGYFNAKAC